MKIHLESSPAGFGLDAIDGFMTSQHFCRNNFAALHAHGDTRSSVFKLELIDHPIFIILQIAHEASYPAGQKLH